MRYINPRFTYLLTYLLTYLETSCKPCRFLHSTCAASCQPAELVGN